MPTHATALPPSRRLVSTRPARGPLQPAGHAVWARGVELARLGRFDDAARALLEATRRSPAESLYWLNLASVRRRQHRLDEALRCAERAFELDRTSRLACDLAAELLRGRKRFVRALELLKLLDPGVERDRTHLVMQASTETTLGRWQDAAQTCLQLLAKVPDDVEGHQQLGFALASLQQYAEAAECFRTASLLEPQLGSAIYSAHYSAWACDWDAVVGDAPRVAEALARIHESGRPGFSPFCLLSLTDDAAAHRAAAAVAAAHMAREAQSAWTDKHGAPHELPAAGPGGFPAVAASPRIRIGFVSADFRTHATSLLLVRTLERLDRSRFEVLLYSHGPDETSKMRERLVAAVDGFVACREMSLVEQAERIRADGIAILVDMSGFTANTRLPVFALRPAPVQALWLAYPSTTGADFIDYLIGDPVLTPLEHAADFTEKIAQLPVCYEPTDELRDHPERSTRAEAGLPEDAFVFACFNQSYKITAEVFDAWCRILRRVPGSVLWLLVPEKPIQAALAAQAAARGIGAERLVFAPFVAPQQHLARLPLADLFVDTFPYGAHTTCSDALWMGLPVVTRIGRSFSARVAASLLHAVGLPELAVADAADYENLAVLLANDADALAAIRVHLDDHRLGLPLFDNARFTRELEALFERMVGRWREGLAPEHLLAADHSSAEHVLAARAAAEQVPAAPHAAHSSVVQAAAAAVIAA